MTWACAREIAAAVASGKASAEAEIGRTLAQITATRVSLNAFTAVLSDSAMAAARRVDADVATGRAVGPLAGVPFAVKNLFDIQGLPTVAGSKIRRDAEPATRDAVLVARLKAAGAILVGALNMDEFAYGFVTENAHDGWTHNPHDPRRTCGGSSGGSAAAVAAGLVPLSLGSDTNGSVRVPAGLCGVFGLKPTFGKLSTEGVFPFAESLDHAGLFARDTGDLRLAYEVMLGAPVESAEESLSVGALGGWFVRGASSEVLDAFDQVSHATRAEVGIDLSGAEAARSAAFMISCAEGGRLHLADLRARPGDFDPAVRDRLLAGALLPDTALAGAYAFRETFGRSAADLFERFDVLVAPATPCTAPLLGQTAMRIDGVDIPVRRNLGMYTQPISYIGLPVLTVPMNRPGLLPIAVQLIAAPGREDRLFALARRLETAGVVAAHRPGVQA